MVLFAGGTEKHSNCYNLDDYNFSYRHKAFPTNGRLQFAKLTYSGSSITLARVNGFPNPFHLFCST